jgi:acyl-CoA synthetase (NDP forming)
MNADNKEASLTKEEQVPDFEYFFHPESIAVVGASQHNSTAEMFLNPLIQSGYKGKIYPIHPKVNEVSGLKAYPSILSIPGPVDHVTCGIKAALTPQLMKECAAKGVKLVQIFTAGFSESGEEQGIRLEKEIVAIARRGNVRVLGPNCMGIYCPSSGISFEPSFPSESGCVGFLAQSGGNSINVVRPGAARGIRFSKVVSFGNACDLNESDFMEYFAHDPQTKIIIGYIEGTRDGRRFFQALRKAAGVKPVIMFKGGVTEAGTRAAASHTGSLAGTNAVWSSLFRQSGVMQVYDTEELVDLLLPFLHFQPLRGRRVALIGSGGGFSVSLTDNCVGEGLIVPSFPDGLKRTLREILPKELDPGTSVGNPADLSVSGWDLDIFSKALETVDKYDGIDFTLSYMGLHVGHVHGPWRQMIDKTFNAIIETKKKLNKPVAFVIREDHVPETRELSFGIQERCEQANIPVFPSFNRAARAISKFIQYHERIQ